MKRLLVLAMLCTPAIALADKTILDGKTTTWNCKQDPVVSLLANDATLALQGACKTVNVTGNRNKVAIESSDTVNVNGNENQVNATAVDQINANGNTNKVTYKGPVKNKKTAVSNTGTDNTVSVAK